MFWGWGLAVERVLSVVRRPARIAGAVLVAALMAVAVAAGVWQYLQSGGRHVVVA